jgi:hypothetical protein
MSYIDFPASELWAIIVTQMKQIITDLLAIRLTTKTRKLGSTKVYGLFIFRFRVCTISPTLLNPQPVYLGCFRG